MYYKYLIDWYTFMSEKPDSASMSKCYDLKSNAHGIDGKRSIRLDILGFSLPENIFRRK